MFHQLSVSHTWYAGHFESWTCLLGQAVGVYLVYQRRRTASDPGNGQDVTTNLRRISLIWSMFPALINWIKRMKRTEKWIWFMYVILLHSGHRHVIGHSCGHLHGGENKNTNTRCDPKCPGLMPPSIQQLCLREAPVVVGLPCLACQCAKLHVDGWTWTVFTCVYLEFYYFYSVSPENFGSSHVYSFVSKSLHSFKNKNCFLNCGVISTHIIIFLFSFSPPWRWSYEWTKHVGDHYAVQFRTQIQVHVLVFFSVLCFRGSLTIISAGTLVFRVNQLSTSWFVLVRAKRPTVRCFIFFRVNRSSARCTTLRAYHPTDTCFIMVRVNHPNTQCFIDVRVNHYSTSSFITVEANRPYVRCFIIFRVTWPSTKYLTDRVKHPSTWCFVDVRVNHQNTRCFKIVRDF
jgi:hypothetical protein